MRAAPPVRFGFIGFRHPHVWDVVKRIREHPGAVIAACCEEDEATRQELNGDSRVTITHFDCKTMLDAVQLDAVVIGDWFGKRGRLVIDCLTRGLSVLADKPICTDLDEFVVIRGLLAKKKLALGLMLDLRDAAVFIELRELVRAGMIGDVQTVNLMGQHPLLPDFRPKWYYEPGKHGGTINDLGVHALDLVLWVTGLSARRVIAARAWRTNVTDSSAFVNAAQFMIELSNGAGVVSDLSYVSPNSQGYTIPQYWRITIWGTRGVAEVGINSAAIQLYLDGERAGRNQAFANGDPGGYLESFLRELRGDLHDGLTTDEVLTATELALKVQRAADQGLRDVEFFP